MEPPQNSFVATQSVPKRHTGTHHCASLMIDRVFVKLLVMTDWFEALPSVVYVFSVHSFIEHSFAGKSNSYLKVQFTLIDGLICTFPYLCGTCKSEGKGK